MQATNSTPSPAGIVPGNHNFLVFFYIKDAYTGETRFSENYTTPKTYSPNANTEEEALKKCSDWAQAKQASKSHFLVGYSIQKIELTSLLDAAPAGVTFEDAVSRKITAQPYRK